MAQKTTLDSPGCKESIIARLGSVTPASPRQWGKMTAHQMLCHLTDSFSAVMGEKEVSPAPVFLPRPILIWIILWAPVKWPHNVQTRPEIAQETGGTPPVEFERDRRALLDSMERFCTAPDSRRTPHPMMGSLNRVQWMRWGYLHMDHHLRQFSA